MKVKKDGNRYLIELGRNEMYLLQKAVEFGAEWMNENGYFSEEKKMKALYEKLIKSNNKV